MSWLLVGFFPKCLTASLPTSQPFCSVKNRRENASLFHEYGPHLQQYIRRDVSYRLLVTMMKRNRSSAATVAFFIFFSCALHNCCVGSQAVATDAVESTQETDGEANANSATVVTTGELHPTEADQNDSGAAVLPKTSKETMLADSTTGLNFSVLAILALRLAMTHLHQGEEGTLNTSDVTGGIQRRRLSTRVPGNQRFASDPQTVMEVVNLLEEAIGLLNKLEGPLKHHLGPQHALNLLTLASRLLHDAVPTKPEEPQRPPVPMNPDELGRTKEALKALEEAIGLLKDPKLDVGGANNTESLQGAFSYENGPTAAQAGQVRLRRR